MSISLLQRVLDAKFADSPAAVITVFVDLAAVFISLFCYQSLTASRAALVASSPDRGLLVGLLLTNVYFAAREIYQMFHMHKLGLGWEYWSDTWNMVDLLGMVTIFVLVSVAEKW